MNDNHNEGIGVLQDTVRHEFYMEILCVCVCVCMYVHVYQV